MLSFVVRLVWEFEREHGYAPNLLYLNENHLEHLREGFDARYAVQDIMDMLGMEILVENEILHPHVEWRMPAAHKHAV
jgi:hypothetical protein